MYYELIRRFGDDRKDEVTDYDGGDRTYRVGDEWEPDPDGHVWEVTETWHSDEHHRPAIVIEPLDD
jgi:hypothetical protein